MGEEIYKAKFTADTTELTKAAKDAESQMSKFTSAVDRHSRRLIAAGAAMTAAMGGIIAKTVSAAASVEEMQNRLRVTFREGTKSVQDWASQHAKAVGRSRFAMERLATQYGVLLNAFGLAREEVVGQSIALTKLTVDWESYNDLPISEVIAKVSSGLAGEAEALRRIGVNVSANAVKQELLNKGYTGSIDKATQLQKVQARLRIILGGLKDAQGDAERTAGDLTNQWRGMQGAIEELNVTFGQVFFKDAKSVIAALADLIRDTSSWVRENERLVQIVGTTGLKISTYILGLGVLGLALVKAKAAVLGLVAAFGAVGGPVAIFVAAFPALVMGLVAFEEWIRGPDGVIAALDKLGDQMDAFGAALDAYDAAVEAAAKATKKFGEQVLAQTTGAMNRMGQAASDLGTKLKSLIAFQNELEAAQAGVTDAAIEASREFAKMPATEAGKALLDYRFLMEDIDKLWPEIATGSTDAMSDMSSAIRRIASLDIPGLAEAWAVSEEEAREELQKLTEETTKATSDLIAMNKQVTDEMIESVEKRLSAVSESVQELEKELLGLSMDIDIQTALNKISAVEAQILGLQMAAPGPGSGTPGEDRLSTARRPKHPGRSESITTNINAPINIARGGTPSSLAKSVASEIGRMKRRGYPVG